MQYRKFKHKILCDIAQILCVFVQFVDFFINIEYNIENKLALVLAR